MSIVTVTTAWQLVCPVTNAQGLPTATTRSLPPNFTPPATRVANSRPTGAMSAVDESSDIYNPGTILPPDTFGGDGDPRWKVAVPIHTTLIVDLFPRPVPTPLEDYRPAWSVTRDGSMVTPVYRDAAMNSHGRMIIMGFLLCLFIRNFIVSIDYLRRGRAKDKTLFYLLAGSQICGPPAFMAIVVGLISDHTDCRVVYTFAYCLMGLSLGIILSGILGLKAYRCLNRSKLIVLVISGLQIASIGLFVLDLVGITVGRTLNGMCSTAESYNSWMPLWSAMLFCETGFLSLCCKCFMSISSVSKVSDVVNIVFYAAWKSSQIQATQGRLSIALTAESAAPRQSAYSTHPPIESDAATTKTRGWWDYVPEEQNTNKEKPPTTVLPQPGTCWSDDGSVLERTSSRASGTAALIPSRREPPTKTFLDRLLYPFRRLLYVGGTAYHGNVLRKPSLHAPEPIPHPPRASQVGRHDTKLPAAGTSILRRPTLPRLWDSQDSVSLESKWSRRLPNMVRLVIRDEMFSTAAMTAFCLFSAIAVSVAARSQTALNATTWLQINWAVTSFLVMRNFSQVVKRHEREEILQNSLPATTGNFGSYDLARPARRDAMPRISFAFNTRNSYMTNRPSPFDDARSAYSGRTSPPVTEKARASVVDDGKSQMGMSMTTTLRHIAAEFTNPFEGYSSEPSTGREEDQPPRPDSDLRGYLSRQASRRTQRNPFDDDKAVFPIDDRSRTTTPYSFMTDRAASPPPPLPTKYKLKRKPSALSFSEAEKSNIQVVPPANSPGLRTPTTPNGITRRQKSRDWQEGVA
ncbi:hypothetical protein FRC03_005214 [Tulasnella sp. 419]|nr:hypothetical protein FRC03_005214 [Tulasnella sp. 419]